MLVYGSSFFPQCVTGTGRMNRKRKTFSGFNKLGRLAPPQGSHQAHSRAQQHSTAPEGFWQLENHINSVNPAFPKLPYSANSSPWPVTTWGPELKRVQPPFALASTDRTLLRKAPESSRQQLSVKHLVASDPLSHNHVLNHGPGPGAKSSYIHCRAQCLTGHKVEASPTSDHQTRQGES